MDNIIVKIRVNVAIMFLPCEYFPHVFFFEEEELSLSRPVTYFKIDLSCSPLKKRCV